MTETATAEPVAIRLSRSDDDRALARLAELDSTRPPAGPSLVAFVGDEPRAAYSLAERRAIADPFHPTAELVALLELWAGQLNGGTRRRRRGRRSSAPQPPGLGRALIPQQVGRRA